MTIFFYIMAAMLSALLLACSVFVVFRAGEKELICKYGQEEKH